MPDLFDKYAHPRPEVRPQIYAYQDTNPIYAGLLKVGYTDRDIDARVAQQYPTLRPGDKKPYKIVLRESAMYSDGTSFTDHDLHKVLARRGFPALKDKDGKKTEWFRCSVKDVQAAIIALKTHSENQQDRTATFGMRPEQKAAVEMTKHYFTQEKAAGRTPKFLWNAKMRFGKTFASYELAKSMGFTRVLILTFKPAVEDAWETDLMTHVDFDGWQFYSRASSKYSGITPDRLDQKRPIVCFGSFQDYLGVDKAGGIKAKNEWVHTTNWDLVIFDEYHFGAWRENARKLFDIESEDSYDALDIEKYKAEEADNAYNETFLPITTDYYLFLSGTPFRSLNSGEFIEDQIFSWTYSDEQKAKNEWKGPGLNPYASLPKMVMMTYKIPDEIQRIAVNSDTNQFDLNTFFLAKYTGKDVQAAQFEFKDYIQKWLDLIRGAFAPTAADDLKIARSQRPVMPYSDARLLNILTHTLWFMPNVASCYAMANLLAEKQNTFYHDYKVNVCAGTQAGVGLAALAPIEASMGDPLKTKTITLSCGKLTTGVTIRPWTGIFMLRNLSSPETYFQAAFRVQSPWTVPKDDGTMEIIKKECYVFDFAINRALTEISDYSCRLNVNEGNPEKKVGEFINFLPVIAYNGSTMSEIKASEILDLVLSGTSATMLARRWESALLVNVDNETLARLLANEEAMEAIMRIEGFRSLNADIQTIINRSSEIKKAKKEKGEDLTPKEKKVLDAEEKEIKSKRKQIQEKLIKFATRIPIFMYLTDYREYSLKDVITQFEPGLFKRVTGLDVKDFELLVSLNVFNEALMNEAVYKFKRYEDASLEYTGISKHSKDAQVGLFSEVISAFDYEEMAKKQLSSVESTVLVQPEVGKEPKPEVAPKPVVKPSVANPPMEKPPAAKPPVIKPKPVTYPAAPVMTSKAAENIPSAKALVQGKQESGIVDLLKVRVGEKVIHGKFGEGTITAMKDGKITVDFEAGSKIFQYPQSFEKGFLKVR